MIEIFRTNVTYSLQAIVIRERILQSYPDYKVNFDLDDCDHILRVEASEMINSEDVMMIVGGLGFEAEILPDDVSWAGPPPRDRIEVSS